MEKTVTFYIDKDEDTVTLHKHDRTVANQLAEGFGESVGTFVTMLSNEILRMPNNSSINLTITKEL